MAFKCVEENWPSSMTNAKKAISANALKQNNK